MRLVSGGIAVARWLSYWMALLNLCDLSWHVTRAPNIANPREKRCRQTTPTGSNSRSRALSTYLVTIASDVISIALDDVTLANNLIVVASDFIPFSINTITNAIIFIVRTTSIQILQRVSGLT